MKLKNKNIKQNKMKGVHNFFFKKKCQKRKLQRRSEELYM